MKRIGITILLAVVALLALSRLAVAQAAPQPVSLFRLDRFAFSLGGNYDWHYGESLNPEPAYEKEFTAGGYAAYVLTPHLAAYGAVVYGVDNRMFRFSPGLHYRQPVGSEMISFSLTYDYYSGEHEQVPFYPHEWAVGVVYARAINKNIAIGASETYGTDNREWRTSLGIRVPLYWGRDS